MLPKINPEQTHAWPLLQQHADQLKKTNLRELFAADPLRLKKFSLRFEDFLFDYSKNIITAGTLDLLTQLAAGCELKKAIEAMFTGQAINDTEGRAVLNTALRYFSGETVYVAGSNVMPVIQEEIGRGSGWVRGG